MRILLFTLLSTFSLFAQTTDPLVSIDYQAQESWVDSTYTSLTLEESTNN